MWNKVPKNEYHKGKPGNKKDPFKKDVIFDLEGRGQYAYPGEVTKIPSGDITMQDVPYPVLGVDNYGNEQMMYPDMDYQFPGDIVTEYPQMLTGGVLQPGGGGRWLDSVNAQFNKQYGGDPSIPELDQAKKGGWLNKYSKMPKKKSSKNIKTSINKLMTRNPLFERNYMLYGAKGPRLYDPSSKYQFGGWLDQYQQGGQPDPQQMYKDSLSLFNLSMDEISLRDRHGIKPSQAYGEPNRAMERLWDANGKRPEIIGSSGNIGIYKKPTPPPAAPSAAPAPYYPQSINVNQLSTNKSKAEISQVVQPYVDNTPEVHAYGSGNKLIFDQQGNPIAKPGPGPLPTHLYGRSETDPLVIKFRSEQVKPYKNGGWLDSYQMGGVTPITTEEDYNRRLLMKNKSKEELAAQNEWVAKKMTISQYKASGNSLPPIYTKDPNDPRLKLYNDSLATSNYTQQNIHDWHVVNKNYRGPGYDPTKPVSKDNNPSRSSDPLIREQAIKDQHTIGPWNLYPPGVLRRSQEAELYNGRVGLLDHAPITSNIQPVGGYNNTPLNPHYKQFQNTNASSFPIYKKPEQPIILGKPPINAQFRKQETNFGPVYYWQLDPVAQQWYQISEQAFNNNTSNGTVNAEVVPWVNPMKKDGGWLNQYQEGGGVAKSYKKLPNPPTKKPQPSAQQLFGIQPVAAESTGINKTPQAGLDYKNEVAQSFHKAVDNKMKEKPNLTREQAQTQVNAGNIYAEGRAKGQGTIRQADPEQGLLSKSLEVASHPFNALDAYVQSGYMPDYFSHSKDAVNPMDHVYSFTPAGLYTQGADALYNDLPTDIEQGNWAGAANDILMGLPLVGKTAKSVSPYASDFVYASKQAGRPVLPTYQPTVRWQPDVFPEDLVKSGQTLSPEQQALTGSWYTYKPEEQLGFYMRTRPGAGNVNVLRLSKREIANLEQNIPGSAKGMSGKAVSVPTSASHESGELIIPKNLRAKAQPVRFDVNPTEYVPQSAGAAPKSLYGQTMTGRFATDIINSQYPSIMGVPRKYFPFKKGGWLDSYQGGGAAAGSKSLKKVSKPSPKVAPVAPPNYTYNWSPTPGAPTTPTVPQVAMTNPSIKQHDYIREGKIVEAIAKAKQNKDAGDLQVQKDQYGNTLGTLRYYANKTEEWGEGEEGSKYYYEDPDSGKMERFAETGAYEQVGIPLQDAAFGAFPLFEGAALIGSPIKKGLSKLFTPRTLPGSPNAGYKFPKYSLQSAESQVGIDPVHYRAVNAIKNNSDSYYNFVTETFQPGVKKSYLVNPQFGHDYALPEGMGIDELNEFARRNQAGLIKPYELNDVHESLVKLNPELKNINKNKGDLIHGVASHIAPQDLINLSDKIAQPKGFFGNLKAGYQEAKWKQFTDKNEGFDFMFSPERQKEIMRTYKPTNTPTQLPGSPNNLIPQTSPNPNLGNPLGTIKDLERMRRLEKYGLKTEGDFPLYQRKLDTDLIKYNDEMGTNLNVKYPNPTQADRFTGSAEYYVPQLNQELQKFNTLMQFGKRPLETQIIARPETQRLLAEKAFLENQGDLPLYFYNTPVYPGFSKLQRRPLTGYQMFQQIQPNKYGGSPRKSDKKLVNYSNFVNPQSNSWLDKYK